jgi:hypothetical protein
MEAFTHQVRSDSNIIILPAIVLRGIGATLS